MQTTRMHELIEKGYKENGLLDRIILFIHRPKKLLIGNLMKIRLLINTRLCGNQ